MALGALQNDVLRMVLKKGLALIATGTVAGLAAGLALTRLMSSQIWGVSPTDPRTFFAVAALILPVGLAACLFPARKPRKWTRWSLCTTSNSLPFLADVVDG